MGWFVMAVEAANGQDVAGRRGLRGVLPGQMKPVRKRMGRGLNKNREGY